MDYVHSRRIKVWGNARVVESDPRILGRLRELNYPANVERAILFEIEAWDVNCPQHIHKRLTQNQVAPIIEQLQNRIAELEAEVRRLKDSAEFVGMPDAVTYLHDRNTEAIK